MRFLIRVHEPYELLQFSSAKIYHASPASRAGNTSSIYKYKNNPYTCGHIGSYALLRS